MTRRTLALALAGGALAFALPAAPASAALCSPVTSCPYVRDVCNVWIDCSPSVGMCFDTGDVRFCI